MGERVHGDDDGAGNSAQGIDGTAWGRMFTLGLLTMASGISIISYVMSNPDSFSAPVIRIAQFSPLWLAGLIGWVVASADNGGSRRGYAPIVLAAILVLPVALLDPWAVVALRMGSGVHIGVKVMFLVAPLGLAVFFAHPVTTDSRAAVLRRSLDLLVMAVVTAGIYYAIYQIILGDVSL